MSDDTPEASFGAGLTAPAGDDRHSEFTDRADAMLRWKNPEAIIEEAGKLQDSTDEHTNLPSEEAEKVANAQAGYGADGASLAKVSTMEKHTEPKKKAVMLKEAISTGKIRRAAFKAGFKSKGTSRAAAVARKSNARMDNWVNSKIDPTKTKRQARSRRYVNDQIPKEVELETAFETGQKARKAAPYVAGALAAGGAVDVALAIRKKKKAKEKTKEAFIRAVNPTFATSSVNAQSGELVVKHASIDAREAAVNRLPQKGLPPLAMDQHIDDIKNSLLGKVDDIKNLRRQIISGDKQKKVRLSRPPSELMDKLKEAGLKDTFKKLTDPAMLTAMGIGATAGGTGMYLSSRPKKSLGGKSSAERDLETMVSAQKARGEDGASFPRRMKNRYVEFSKGLATDFRKSPGAATAMGAISGATAGALAARMLGAGK